MPPIAIFHAKGSMHAPTSRPRPCPLQVNPPARSTVKSIMFVVVLVLSLIAAGAEAQRAPDTLGKIKAAKSINVAFSGDSLPFSYVGEGNKPAGYSIDLCQRVIAGIGQAVGEANLKVNWIVGTAAERVQMVATGKADMECANTTMTQTRLKDVDFSNLIFVDGGGFLVTADAPINRFTDLNGKKIAVIKGTTTEKRLAEAMKSHLVSAQVTTISDGSEGVALLTSGAVDAFRSEERRVGKEGRSGE